MSHFSATRIAFGLTIALFVAALVFMGGTAQAAAVAVASFGFLGACIRSVGFAVRDNPVSTEMLAKRDIVHSALLSEAARKRRH